MKILLVHQNFPGQFRHLATHLSRQIAKNEVVAIGRRGCPGLPGISVLSYDIPVAKRPPVHPYLRPMEGGVIAGQAVFRLASKLKHSGFVPDVILGHPGWGETLYLKEVFPRAILVHFCEFFYHTTGADTGFDPEFPLTVDDHCRITTKNALQLLALDMCDFGVTPTAWQRSLFPVAYRDKIKLAHEGINTRALTPNQAARFKLPNGKMLCPGDPVITYVSRNLEPYRGFHIFMRSLPALLAANKECQVVIVGGDSVSYGSMPPGSANWREHLSRDITIDASRVHFLGCIPYRDYINLLHVSAAHVYLTYPFVLSWSLLEAMAAGCLVIASRTPPVQEMIEDGRNGLLFDFFDSAGLIKKIQLALDQPTKFHTLRKKATADVRMKFDISRGIGDYQRLLSTALDRRNA